MDATHPDLTNDESAEFIAGPVEAMLENELTLDIAEPEQSVAESEQSAPAGETNLGETNLEEALSVEEPHSIAFEELVQSAIDKVGGELLFQMHLDTPADAQHVAAISMGDGDERRIALVILPESGALRVETASESANPLARIAQAYAGVAVAYKAAA